ncbi:MAG: O-antigen ligase family protein [Planctomycetota bacterium]
MMPSEDQPVLTTAEPWRQPVAAGAAVALMVMVLLPCFVPTTPVRHFDADPRLNPAGIAAEVLTDLGPAAVAWLQTLTVVVAVVGVVSAYLAGVKISRATLVLATLGLVAVWYHATKSTARWEDWTQAGAWSAAVAAGVAAMHLGQIDAARRWVVSLTAAAAIPLLAEAGWYVFVEHTSSVAFFESNREELLAARGIEPGSEQAVLYERRLRFADATGTFGLSNVLASIAAAMAVAGLGLGFTRPWRNKSPLHRVAGIAALLAGFAGLAIVILTASKGAVVALTLTSVLAAFVWLSKKIKLFQRLIPGVAITVVAIAFAAVLVRGALGPPLPPEAGFVADAPIEGERSLLFRYQYFSAAARIAADHPLLGSGSRGFADLYPAAKDPLNPETVTSAHSVFVDHVAILGLGGVAWSALILWWLWRAGRGVFASTVSNPSEDRKTAKDSAIKRTEIWTAIAAAVAIFAPTLAVRQATLDPFSSLVWLAGIAAFTAVAVLLGSRCGSSAKVSRVVLLLVAALALIHNQVEMAFFQAPSVGLLWVLVGAAGAGSVFQKKPTSKNNSSVMVSVVAGVIAGSLFVALAIYAIGAGRHEHSMAGAERALVRGDIALAVSRLADAQDTTGLDTRALNWRVRLHALEPLVPLYNAGRGGEAQQRAAGALAWIEEVIATNPQPITPFRLRASLLGQLAYRKSTPEAFLVAESAYAALADKSPYNIADRLAWADLTAAAGQQDLARQRYAEVLALREAKYLDPADPLTAEQLARARAAVGSATD